MALISLALESYASQSARWPQSGRHVLAQYDDDSYAREWTRRIEDITPFVREQHEILQRDGNKRSSQRSSACTRSPAKNQLGVD